MIATAPVGPVGDTVNVAGHLTVQMNQFHGSQPATGSSIEPAKVVILRTKTHW